MAIRIRLQRHKKGTNLIHCYSRSKSSRDGRYIEKLDYKTNNPAIIDLNFDRLLNG